MMIDAQVSIIVTQLNKTVLKAKFALGGARESNSVIDLIRTYWKEMPEYQKADEMIHTIDCDCFETKN